MEKHLKWLEKVISLRSEGDLQKIISYLNQVLQESPKDPEVYFQIAWTHDSLGKESDAVPAYEKAISLGLNGKDLESAYLGLGSTYRSLGDYANSKRIFEKGIADFPENSALKIFYAMTLYNLKDHNKSMEILIKELIKTTSDENIKSYSRALLLYSEKLDETFE